MPSASLRLWQTTRAASLNEMRGAHVSVGGTAPGRRYATQQINQAYVVLLSSQFQGFCRDLHSECVEVFAQSIPMQIQKDVMRVELLRDRKLKQGNANPGNIGADFGRLGIAFWPAVLAKLGGKTTLLLSEVNVWRSVCDGLAQSFDRVMSNYLSSVTGNVPW